MNEKALGLLEHLQTYYEYFLIDFQADVVKSNEEDGSFIISSISYRDNGTLSYKVISKEDGILVENFHLTDKMEEPKLLRSNKYESIDKWMKFHRYNKSEIKSKPRSNYRTYYPGIRV